MTTIHFNTRRMYTEHGQRISATLHDDGVVTFFDHDRQIDGEFALNGMAFDYRIVWDTYDHNHYKSTPRSWADGVQLGGCNTMRKDFIANHEIGQ